MINMNVEKEIENKIMGFGCNKGPLNLNYNYIESSQFCKLLN
jgi:hypothetical protein